MRPETHALVDAAHAALKADGAAHAIMWEDAEEMHCSYWVDRTHDIPVGVAMVIAMGGADEGSMLRALEALLASPGAIMQIAGPQGPPIRAND